MRKIFLFSVLIFSASFLYAGDIANYVNLGFSKNSDYFMFAQYGMSEKGIYSELFTVDVRNNKFVPGGVMSREYSGTISSIEDGTGLLFMQLEDAYGKLIKKYGIEHLKKGRCLYLDSNGECNRTVGFRDFSTGYDYSVKLEQQSEKSGESVKSAFFIRLLVKKEGVSSDSYEVGNGNFFRNGVGSYKIKAVIISPDDRSMVFVIEKILQEKKGFSVRYMVETLDLR